MTDSLPGSRSSDSRAGRSFPDGSLPWVIPLDPAPEPRLALERLAPLPHCALLESALRDPLLGRYSFLAADPFEYWEVPPEAGDVDQLRLELLRWKTPTVGGLPPFQGGAIALLSYDLNRSIERIPPPRFSEFPFPGIAIGLYDVVVAFDHATHQAWVISQGFPASTVDERRRRAEQRAAEMVRRLAGPAPDPTERNDRHRRDSIVSRLPPDALAPCHPVAGPNGLVSNFSADMYRRSVQCAIEYIRAGDIFQVNLAQRLLFPAQDDSLSLYLRLRERNPATFAAYFDLGRFQIVSASPERFLRASSSGQVETRPIKGTRQRGANPVADLYAADELLASEKDRAENVMIVDLLRNDLSRVCQPNSVRVTQLCDVEVYRYVQHLVSAVRGELLPGLHPLDLIWSAFPGGSITGAPKVRAMEIIAELEPTARGPYCGALGYIGFDGAIDLNILIRTITAGYGWWQLPVGGGIVAQSSPEREYEETWHKARGLLQSLVP